MSKTIQYMSNRSRNVSFSKSKNPTPKIIQDLGVRGGGGGGELGYWGGKGCGGIGGDNIISLIGI